MTEKEISQIIPEEWHFMPNEEYCALVTAREREEINASQEQEIKNLSTVIKALINLLESQRRN